MVPPFAQSNTKMYHGRVEAIASILSYLEAQKEKYVILSDCNIASDVDYADLMNKHITAGADVTMVYERAAIPEALQTDNYTFDFDENGRMTQLRCNDYRTGVQNLSMNVIVMGREELIAMVRDATVRNYVYLERDILAPALKLLNVRGYEYTGYRARIYNMKSYFDENMRLFRGGRVAKGASVKNCVLMQGTAVEQGVEMEYIVTDKNVTITERRHLKGNENFPVYVEKGTTV